MYLAGSHFFDTVQDKGEIEWLNAGIIAIGMANITLSRLEVDNDTFRDMHDALGRVMVMGANAQNIKLNSTDKKARETYLKSVAGKASALIATGLWLGGRFAGKDDAHLQAIRDFGLALGMIIQLSDDCIDIKEDLRKGIFTLPILDGLAMENHPDHVSLVQMIAGSQVSEQQVNRATTLLEKMGTLETSQRLIRAYQVQATAFFDILPYLKPHFVDYVVAKN